MSDKYELYKSEIRAIGSIVHHWSYLEHGIERLIWVSLEVEGDVGRAVTSDIQFKARIKMMGKIIRAKHPKMSKVWAGVAKTLTEIEESRNLIVHGIWSRDRDTSDPIATSFRKKSSGPHQISGERFPPDRMKSIDESIMRAGAYLVQLESVIEGANAALRKKSETQAPIR